MFLKKDEKPNEIERKTIDRIKLEKKNPMIFSKENACKKKAKEI